MGALLSISALGLALATSGEGPIVLDIGEPVDLGSGGGWGKAFPKGDGNWWLLASGDFDYRLFEVSADLQAGPLLRGLTGEIYPCVDHAMSACPDGTYLHVCSGNLEAKDDSGYYFHYDENFDILDHAVIAERDSDYRYNDAPVLCSEALRGTVFHPYIQRWSPFIELDGSVSTEDPPFEVNPVPPIPGNALFYEKQTNSVLRFGAAFEDNTLTIDRLTLDVDQPPNRLEIPLLSDDYEVYWPQSVERIEDLYFLAHMGRPRDMGWSEDLGNVYLAIFDSRFNLIEHNQLTFYEVSDIGAMRPFIAVQDDILLLVFDYLIRPFALNIKLDLDQIANGNRAPFADAGKSRIGIATEPTLLDGRGSWDPNDDPLEFSWEIAAAPADSVLGDEALSGASMELALLHPDVPGDYLLSLTVSDGVESDSAETTVSVRSAVSEDLAADGAPYAVAVGPSKAVTGSEVLIDGSASGDPDGDDLWVSWRFLALPEGSALTNADWTKLDDLRAGFVPDQVGNYKVLMVLSDGRRTAVDTLVVRVIGPYMGCAGVPWRGQGVLLVGFGLGLLGLRRRLSG